LAHAFATPQTEPDFDAPEESGPEEPKPSDEESGVAVAVGGQESTSGELRFMQESELDNTGLVDSQEWVDVPQDQVTEVEATATTAETYHDEGIAADQAVTAVQQPEVINMISVFSVSSLECRSSRHRYQRLGILTGPMRKKAGFHPSPGYKLNLEHLRRHPLRTRHRISRTRTQQR
jgi:hypothetical protein